MEADDYVLKLDKVPEDGSKFIEVTLQDGAIHPIIQKENSIANYVKGYLKKVDGYAVLILSGNKTGKLYGLARLHKVRASNSVKGVQDKSTWDIVSQNE